MGRFYRTSDSTPVDYMYRMNTPLMTQVLGANDQYIDQELDQSGKVGAFTFNYAPQDQESANQTMNNYHNQANTITDAISKDPANWRKQQGSITGLTKQLQSDYTSGDISKYLTNYNTRKQNFNNIDQQVALYNKSGGVDKDGNTVGVDPVTAQLAKNYADSQFKGTKNPDGTYNAYRGIPLMDNMDVAGKLGNIVSKMKDSGYSFTNDDITRGGQYFNKTTNSTTGLAPADIMRVLNDKIQSDPQLSNYLRQRQQIGQISGVKVGANGNLISPLSTSPLPMTDQENNDLATTTANYNKIKDPVVRKQLMDNLNTQVAQRKSQQQLNWDNSNYLTPIMQGVIGQYAHSTTTKSNELSANPVWSTTYTQGMENMRQSRDLSQKAIQFKETQDNANRIFEEKQAWDKYKFDNAPVKDGKGGKGTGSGTPVDNIPTNTGVSPIAFNQLNSLQIPSAFTPGKQVPVFSDEGMRSRVVNSRNTLADLNTKLGVINNKLSITPDSSNLGEMMNYSNLVAQKRDLTQKAQDAKNDLYTAAQQYGQTEKAVLNNDPQAGNPLSQSDRNVYKEFQQNGDPDGAKFKAYIANLRKNNPDIPMTDQDVNDQSLFGKAKQFATGAGQTVGELSSLLNPKGNPTNTSSAPNASNNANYKSSPVVQAAEDKLQSYYGAKKKVSANNDTYLGNISKEVIKSDAITPNVQDGDNIRKIFLDNPTGATLLDANGNDLTKNGMSSFHFGGSGFMGTGGTRKNYGMNFDGGEGNLADYIRNNNVGMTVSKVGATSTAGKGTGAMKVFFNDPTGKLPSGVPFYISLSHDQQNSIGNYFKGNKDAGVSRVANYMLDPDANSIGEQIHSSPDNSNSVISITMNGSQIPVYVNKMDNGHVIAYMKIRDPKDNNNIKAVPFPRIKDQKGNPVGGADGDFNNTDEFIKNKQLIEQLRSNQK